MEKVSVMDKIQKFLEEKFIPVGDKISRQRHLLAIRNTMLAIIPLTIVGGFACLIANPPVPDTMTEATGLLSSFMLAWQSFANTYGYIFSAINQMTLGSLALYVCAALSYEMGKQYNLNPLNSIFSGVSAFLIVGGYNPVDGTFSLSAFSATNVFGAMFIAIIVIEVNNFFSKKNLVIKLPDVVPPNVASPFNVLIPMAVNLVILSVLNAISLGLAGCCLTQLFQTILSPILNAVDSLPSMMFIEFLSQLFWFFGMHGGSIVGAVKDPIMTVNLAENLAAWQEGLPLPNVFAVIPVWANVYILVVPTLLAIIFFSKYIGIKSAHIKTVSKVAIVPAIFGITEPFTFGMPMVLNPYTMIPWLLITPINIAIYYFIATSGLVTYQIFSVPWPTPIVFAAYLSNMDVRDYLWMCVFAVVDFILFLPFLKAYDKKLYAEELERAKELETEANN